jgi:hypothetical protein
VIIYYCKDTSGSEKMSGIQFFDKNNVSIFKAGFWSAAPSYKEQRIDLKEGERILGVKSSRRNQEKAFHYDV